MSSLTALLLLALYPSQTPPPSFQSLSQQAEAARNAGQLERALDLYKKALKLNPKWADGLWTMGSIAYDLDHYDACAPAFRQLAALKPESAPAWTMSGLCEYRLHRYEAAAASLARAEHLKFEEPAELGRAARLHLALSLTKTGAFEKALVVLTELTRADRKTPDVIVAAGIAGLRRAWLPSEVPEAERDLVFKLGDAMAAVMELDYSGAMQKFEAASQQYPSDPNVHFRFGAFLNTQDSNRSVEEIRKAVALDPGHVPALVGLTMIYLKREERQAALDAARQAAKASPGDFSARIALGRALLANEDPAGAAAELELAAKLAPESPEVRLNLASAYTRLGRKEDAARELEQFKRLEHLAK